MSTRKQEAVRGGSGNVFADLGLPEAEELLAKAELASRIGRIIKGRHLTQAEAATVLDTTQPSVSNLIRGRIDGFSMERLIRFLNALDRDVEIVVKRRPRSRAVARTRVAPA
ncbi:MAG: helix-turn-helix transcriptional regulator [Gemmatimonadota bacterium]